MTTVRFFADFLPSPYQLTLSARFPQLMHYHKIQRCMEFAQRKHWAGPTELGTGETTLFIREYVFSSLYSLSPAHFLLRRVRSLTVGILAYGGISREIARLFKAFGANIVVCTRAGKPQPHTGFRLEGCGDPDGSIPSNYYSMEKESVKEFLGECDVVVSSTFDLPPRSSPLPFGGSTRTDHNSSTLQCFQAAPPRTVSSVGTSSSR